jgi:hypothetical protein
MLLSDHMPLSYSALLDSHTSALLALSSHIPTIVFLNEATADTIHVPGVNHPNYVKSFPLISASPDTYPQWTWDFKSRKFAPTVQEALIADLRARSQLAVGKRDLVNKIVRHINIVRQPVWTEIRVQETVYIAKKIEAQRFKDSGYLEESVTEYPFLLTYADYAGIPLRQAADDILFKAKLCDDLLAKTEVLRLKYFSAVKEAHDPDILPGILDELLRDCYSISIK